MMGGQWTLSNREWLQPVSCELSIVAHDPSCFIVLVYEHDDDSSMTKASSVILSFIFMK